MPRVVALYRYPVKGFTPETCDSLTVLDQGRIVGDRVLGFRFANSGVIGDDWSNKHQFIALVNTPGIARLQLRFDHGTRRLCISREGVVLVSELLDEQGRNNIVAVIENYVLKLDENPVSSHPGRLPLRLVGDGVTPRYQDNEAGQITLHSRASLAAVGVAVGDNGLNELRFRSNIAIDGLDAWEEQGWVGRKIRIGRVNFDVVAPKSRCLATHANPDSGERDLPILQTLTRTFSQKKPTFAVAMVTCGAGGMIHVGDEVALLD
ncbi:MOSC domain-containing protein [Candidatus Methylobacter oryzae]|uniref:MOSC domain-containing protein n=1 Tax=Candidatus Methylobacter oryzae TaxID=2497749 RepID=A0ABY3CES5_9GAMM|nr:MOSC domain-containing protein [Candidatus Methylobacter oryzae]TRX00531.1 MOSC domain-containing protein [Candidatus Methylobacter oryzae]